MVLDPTAAANATSCYFVLFLLHVGATIGHFQGGNLQRKTCTINGIQVVRAYVYEVEVEL